MAQLQPHRRIVLLLLLMLLSFFFSFFFFFLFFFLGITVCCLRSAYISTPVSSRPKVTKNRKSRVA